MGNSSEEKLFFSKFNKFVFFVVILLFFTVSFRSIDISINVSSAGNLEWSSNLYFDEPGGANDNIIFGEATDASDGQDSYDVPAPPPGIPSYIRSYFDSGLDEPYDYLIYDIKKYPDDYKIWNLYVQWFPSDYSSASDITISWNKSEIGASEYKSIVLYDHDNEIIVADMKIDNNYTYTSSAMVLYYYQVICNDSSSQSNQPPFQPSNPSPKNKATNVNIETTLTWTGGDPNEGDTVTYDVYFGKTSTPPIVSNNQSYAYYNTGSLDYNTDYYWNIVSWDDNGLCSQGQIWQFRTETYIQPPPQNNPPIADANGPYRGYVNKTITFDASESKDSDGVIEYYRWDFTNNGKWDTEFIEEVTITYSYSKAGNYSIKLQVKDDLGATDTAESTVTILMLEEDKQIPVAIANGPYSGLVNKNITFDASNSYDSDGSLVNYTWDFGDGKKCYNIKATHKYTTQGTYSVTLTVVDNDGLSDIDKTTAHIFDNDADEDGWGDDEENKYGTDPNNSQDYPIDTDNDHIPDSEDNNDDNDGLSDVLEEKLGSDPKNKSDVLSISINGIIHFIIDTNKDGKSDLFYNSRNGNTTKVDYKKNNQYILDVDGDGKWDYIYDYTYGTLSPYKEEESSSFLYLTFIVIFLIALFLLLTVVRIFYKK